MRRPLALLSLAVATATTVGLLSAGSLAPAGARDVPFSVLQMNLCLSGVAGCYSESAYPSAVHEAEEQIHDDRPEAVTLNEACSGDAERIARRTGYRMRFAPVLVHDETFPCVDPGGRGVFGLAVLTRERIEASTSRAFAAPSGAEERRWLCATTDGAVTVCTAHLDTRGSVVDRRANDLECAELREVLAGYAGSGTTVFGGDVNRRQPCAPAAMWASEDSAASQVPGIQHIYGSASLGAPAPRVAAATYTDHDYFVADVRPPPVLAG